MSIKIHYGPNGTYKTSGAIQDDLIPAFLAGRTIVTNVRGMSRERLFDALNLERDPGGEFITVDADSEAGMQRMARFFHWAPLGALVFVDEASSVWPKSMRPADIAELDYPGGAEEAEKVDRPKNFYQAFEKHRHWNWDLILTTPNIKKIRDEIRECSDGAYKHKNLALIGFRGQYVEGFHMSDDSGANKNDFISINRRKVRPTTFKCYDSTKTGVVSDTISGRSIFKNPRIVALLGVLVLALYFGFRGPTPAILGGKSRAVMPASPAPAVVVSPQVSPARSVEARYDVGGGGTGQIYPALEPALITEFRQGSFSVVGYAATPRRVLYMFRFDGDGPRNGLIYSGEQLASLGLRVFPRSDCAAELTYGAARWFAVCSQQAPAGDVVASVAGHPPLPEPLPPASGRIAYAQPAQVVFAGKR